MAYTTLADLELRFGSRELAKLTDRVAGTVMDAAVIAQALNDADAEIDGYLAGRYALPLATVPAALAQIAGDIARHTLWGERRTAVVKDRYEEALRRLKEISRGTFRLDVSAALPPAEASNGASVTEPSRPRVFKGLT